jgi:WD40 repeat protein
VLRARRCENLARDILDSQTPPFHASTWPAFQLRQFPQRQGERLLGISKWSAAEEKPIDQVLLDGADARPAGVAFALDEKLVAFSDYGDTAVYEVAQATKGSIDRHTTKPLAKLVGDVPMSRPTTDLLFSRDGKTIYLCTPESPSLRVHEVSSGKLLAALEPPGASADWLAFAPDGRLFVHCKDGSLHIVSDDLKQVVRTYKTKVAGRMIAFTANSEFIAVKTHLDRVSILNVNTGAIAKNFTGYSEGVNCLAISPTGQLAIGCARASEGPVAHADVEGQPMHAPVYILDVTSGEPVATLR